MKGINEDKVVDFIRLTEKLPYRSIYRIYAFDGEPMEPGQTGFLLGSAAKAPDAFGNMKLCGWTMPQRYLKISK